MLSEKNNTRSGVQGKFFLTIAIPTYNRCAFLDRCLHSLRELKDYDDVEILVSNNASTDNTLAILEKFKDVFPALTIVSNKQNMGMDFNISQSFEKAKGEYVWVFGDDDYILPFKLKPLLNIVREKKFGVLHIIPSYAAPSTTPEISDSISNKLTAYTDSYIFFKELHFWTTFLTSNIVNKNLVKDIDPFRFKNTYLPQLSWVIPAIFAVDYNIIIRDQIIVCESDNTGGYRLYEVFGKNYNSILSALIKDGIDKRIKPVTNNALLKSFFPLFLHRDNSEFEKEDYLKIMLPVFWPYREFWKNIFPVLFKRKIKRLLHA